MCRLVDVDGNHGLVEGPVRRLGVFVTDRSILPVVRQVRDRHVDRAKPPASTVAQVTALFRPGYVVEIEALAVVHDPAVDPEDDSA